VITYQCYQLVSASQLITTTDNSQSESVHGLGLDRECGASSVRVLGVLPPRRFQDLGFTTRQRESEHGSIPPYARRQKLAISQSFLTKTLNYAAVPRRARI